MCHVDMIKTHKLKYFIFSYTYLFIYLTFPINSSLDLSTDKPIQLYNFILNCSKANVITCKVQRKVLKENNSNLYIERSN